MTNCDLCGSEPAFKRYAYAKKGSKRESLGHLCDSCCSKYGILNQATEKQKIYMRRLGINYPTNVSKKYASFLIDKAKK